MGLLKSSEAPAEGVQGSEMGANPEVVKGLVNAVYGKHFDAVKKALIKSDKNTITVMIPSVVNMAMMAYEKESGQPVDALTAVKALLQVILMLTDDSVKTVLKRPLTEDELHTLMRNAMTLYLKGHKELIPPEIMRSFEQLGTTMSMHRGKNPTGQPQGLVQGGQMAEGAPPAEGMLPTPPPQPQPEEEMPA